MGRLVHIGVSSSLEKGRGIRRERHDKLKSRNKPIKHRIDAMATPRNPAVHIVRYSESML